MIPMWEYCGYLVYYSSNHSAFPNLGLLIIRKSIYFTDISFSLFLWIATSYIEAF